MSLDATLKCVPAGISIPVERVSGVSATRLNDSMDVSPLFQGLRKLDGDQIVTHEALAERIAGIL